MNNLIISGYGKMGKEIEKLAPTSGWNILAKIDNQSQWDAQIDNIKKGDVIIDFSTPENVVDNIEKAFELDIPIVVGTTGWDSYVEEIKKRCIENNKSLIYGSNFSIGVNVFFEINKQLASLMNLQNDYDVIMEEIHHTEKLDSPSGTAISLAKQILNNLNRKDNFVNHRAKTANELSIISKRIPKIPGTHIIKYQSEIDEIEIKHTAKSRKGFAKGAIWAASWIIGKKGFYDFNKILFNKL